MGRRGGRCLPWAQGSCGVHVAATAGLPASVVQRAAAVAAAMGAARAQQPQQDEDGETGAEPGSWHLAQPQRGHGSHPGSQPGSLPLASMQAAAAPLAAAGRKPWSHGAPATVATASTAQRCRQLLACAAGVARDAVAGGGQGALGVAEAVERLRRLQAKAEEALSVSR